MRIGKFAPIVIGGCLVVALYSITGRRDSNDSSNVDPIESKKNRSRILPVEELPFNVKTNERAERKREIEGARKEARSGDFANVEKLLAAAEMFTHDPARWAVFVGEGLVGIAETDFSGVSTFLQSDRRSNDAVIEAFVFGWEFETFDAEFHEPERALEGFRIFADESPGLAAEFVEFLPGNEIKGVAAFELSERWFEGNREAALTWLSGLASAEREESRPFQSFAAEAMAEMWALEAPNSALEWALGREDQEKWFDFISVAASVYGETDPSGASNWFFTLQPESLRQELVPVMAGAVAQKDFDSAVLLINSATDGKAREEAIMAAAMASVDEAPLRTIQWLLSLEESPETLDTIYHTGAAWADHSPVDVAEWLATAPDNMKGVDQVIAGMISSHAQHEPESCFRWALQIQNEVSREQALEELFYDWEIKRGVANMKSDLNRLQVSINGANVELVNEVLERRSMERN